VQAPEPLFSDPQVAAAGGAVNKRCSNHKLRTELGLELQFPTIETGLLNSLRR